MKTFNIKMARNIEKEYQKLTPEQAVLHCPASYIGSTNETITETWVPNKKYFGSH